MRGKVALLSLVGLLVWAPAAFSTPPPVNVTLEECPNLSIAEVERIFNAELGTAPTTTMTPSVTEVTITCEGVRIIVRVKDPLSRKTVQRSFDTSTFDERAMPRLVALAASELVLASWAELYSNPTPSVEPEGVEPSPEEASRARDTLLEKSFPRGEPQPPKRHRLADSDEPDERVLRLVALGSVRTFTDHEGTLYGGGARLGEERLRFVGWALDVLVEHGSVEALVGSQRPMREVTSTTLGASLLAYYRFKFLTLRAGAGLRAGVVASGTPALAPWGWPLGVSTWTIRIGSFVTDLSGEAGYVVFPVSGGGTVSGYWVSGQLGLGMVL